MRSVTKVACVAGREEGKVALLRSACQRIFLQQPYLVVGRPLEVATGIPRRIKGARLDRPFWVQVDGEATVFRIGEVGGLAGWYGVNVWWCVGDGEFPEFPNGPTVSGFNRVALDDPVGTFPIHGANGDLWPMFLQFAEPVVSYEWTAQVRRTAPGSTAAPVTVDQVTLRFI
jgi:hypothetical protein